MVRKILIFGHSNIGDVCYDLAVINPLRQRYPDAKIFFLTSSRCQDIVDDYKGIDRIIRFDRHGKDKGLFNRLRFISGLRKEKFDLAVVLKSSMAYKFLGISCVWRVKKKAKLQYKHPVDQYLCTLRTHGLAVETASFSFGLREDERIFCEDFLTKKGVSRKDTVIGILPLAAWSLKSWPIEKWNKLAEILKSKYGIKLLNLGKMPDSDLGRRIAREISGQIIPADNTTLAQAKALLQRCRLFIGPDSSFLHLASCMGVETIGLYGATSAEHFYPYLHRHNIVWPREKLTCMPCYPGAGPSCNKGKNRPDFGSCMEEIRVEDVLAVVKERLNLG